MTHGLHPLYIFNILGQNKRPYSYKKGEKIIKTLNSAGLCNSSFYLNYN